MLLQQKNIYKLNDHQKIGQKIYRNYLTFRNVVDYVQISRRSLPRKLGSRVHSVTQESGFQWVRLKKVKQNLLDLGTVYYAASRIVDGVALMTDLSIWRGGSGNTKLKLHLHLPTFLYTTKHKHQTQNTKHKHKTQTTNHKLWYRDLRGPGARTTIVYCMYTSVV